MLHLPYPWTTPVVYNTVDMTHEGMQQMLNTVQPREHHSS